MLARSSRLRDSSQIREVIRRGRRAHVGVLTVHSSMLTTRVDSPAAAAFVVPRRVGNAVERNTVTRRLRHLLRSRLESMPPGVSIVVRVGPGAADLSYDDLGIQLDGGLAKTSR